MFLFLWAWFIGADLQGNLLSGNSKIMVLSSRLEGGYRAGSAKLSTWLKGTYSLQDTVVTANTLEASFQTDQPLSPKVEMFLLATYFTDPVARVSYRSDGGIGLKYRFLEDSSREISLSAAPLYSFEKFANQPENQDVRLSVRPKLEWKTAQGIQLIALLFYQPRINRFSDYRLTANLRWEIPLTLQTRMVGEIEDRYVSVVPQGVQPNDLRVTIGIAWKIKR